MMSANKRFPITDKKYVRGCRTEWRNFWILLYWCQILIDINIRSSERWKIASCICYLNSYNNMWSILRCIWTSHFWKHNLSLALGLNIANPKSKSVLSHLWQEQIFTVSLSEKILASKLCYTVHAMIRRNT